MSLDGDGNVELKARTMTRITPGVVLLTLMLLAAKPSASCPPDYLQVKCDWGLAAANPSPNGGLAIDDDNTLYVLNDPSSSNRLTKYTSTLEFIDGWSPVDSQGNPLTDYFGGIAVASDGDIFITALTDDRVYKYANDGTYLISWGTHGDAEGQFNGPIGIATTPNGNVYVADSYNDRVQVFTGDGVYLDSWMTLDDPHAMTATRSGNIIVCSYTTATAQTFSSSGLLINQWSYLLPDFCLGGDESYSWDICVDLLDNVYIATQNEPRIQVFTPDGQRLCQFGEICNPESKVSSPGGIAVNTSGHILVTDEVTRCIVEVSAPSVPVRATTWGRLKSKYD